tara:strand:- start:220 stop:765 length:546 start_codon:yes stop_codon:yes gene_type:complete
MSLHNNVNNQIETYYEIKVDENNINYYFYKVPIMMHVYSNVNLNFDFIRSFHDKYRVWLKYENRMHNSMGETINDDTIDIINTFYSKSLNFINFISDNTIEIYNTISVNKLKFVWEYESKRIEEILRKVVYFDYRVLASYLRDNNRENPNTEVIFDNYIEIRSICDNNLNNSEIQDYLNNN